MIDIVNHSVKVKDIGLLQYMYPDYIILDKPVLFSERPIIFTGETKHINRIKNLGVNYIIVSVLPEIDLTDRLKLLEVVFAHHKKKVPKYLLAFYEEIDEITFMDLVKEYWITGKWRVKEYTNSGLFLEFVKSFKTDTYTIAKTYIELLNRTGAEYIETSLLTFLNRVVVPSGKLSNWYKKIIDEFRTSKYDLIKGAMTNYLDSPIDNVELKIFNLILDLNKRY